ncbi:Uncharacterized conserved protein [Kluyvera cryocrescens]|uniref:Uncharacterized conserved protein n=1 Tax=Kluyvera cryocrescens TaxID=580 RepID=A0A485C1Q5_KLUCR|nr:Uncharacterized conserved protein [Kluyvera cryocrescens]
MAIGLPTPRPALRLVNTTAGDTRLRFSLDRIKTLPRKCSILLTAICLMLPKYAGFIVCAKSPSCGMERVRLYDEQGNRGAKEGVGLFTAALRQRYPWLPIEEDGRLHDPILRENFVARVFALHELNALRQDGLSRGALLAFHSRYKLHLLAHSQPGYRKIGPFIARIHEWDDLEAFFIAYREKLMAILQQPRVA